MRGKVTLVGCRSSTASTTPTSSPTSSRPTTWPRSRSRAWRFLAAEASSAPSSLPSSAAARPSPSRWPSSPRAASCSSAAETPVRLRFARQGGPFRKGHRRVLARKSGHKMFHVKHPFFCLPDAGGVGMPRTPRTPLPDLRDLREPLTGGGTFDSREPPAMRNFVQARSPPSWYRFRFDERTENGRARERNRRFERPLRRGRRSARLRPASRPRRRDDRVRGRRTALPRPLPRVLGPSAPLREAAGARHAAARRSASDRGTRCCSLPARPTDACRWTGRRSPTAAWPSPTRSLRGRSAGKPGRFARSASPSVTRRSSGRWTSCARSRPTPTPTRSPRRRPWPSSPRVSLRAARTPAHAAKRPRTPPPEESSAPGPSSRSAASKGSRFPSWPRRRACPAVTLVRAFSARTGLTPHRYLQALRANRARRLIADGLAPSQAAAQSGFSDQAHMTRVFKALFGLTPARYRASVERGRRA